MRPSQPRIPPRPPSDWDQEVFDALAVFAPSVARSGSEPRPARTGAGARRVNALETLVQHPKLARAFLTFNQHLLQESALPVRTRELLILRVAWRRRCEYEWAQHVLIARGAGLRDEEIERVRLGPDAPGWSAADAALLRAVDELETDACISDATWKNLAESLDRRQLMDLVFTVGAYDLLAMAFNSFGLELDEGLVGFSS
jgi:AhpD family alkylhydroperoxidase